MIICAVNASLLAEIDLPAKSFAAWLHFNRDWEEQDAELVRKLIAGGCRYILASGNDSDRLHEEMDFISLDETDDLVLTASKQCIDESTALEFFATRCPGDPCSFRLISVVDFDTKREAITTSKMINLIIRDDVTDHYE